MFCRKKKEKFRQNNFITVDNFDDVKKLFGFTKEPLIVEDAKDLDVVESASDFNGRRRNDVTILATFAANVPAGKMLEIGTYYGRGAASIATNSPESTVYTVNVLPEQVANNGGAFSTEFLTKDQIGSYFREKNIPNIKQVYANTKAWKVEEEISDLSLVFIDGCHDEEFVYSDTKLILDRVKKGGFVLWHDFSPEYRSNFCWINDSMKGVERLMKEKLIKPYIINVRGSWIGIWRKE
jgi:predicted O-methyltransferase YrrM